MDDPNQKSDLYLSNVKIYTKHDLHQSLFFVCFVALRRKSTAMVMAGRSVHLATLFPGQA